MANGFVLVDKETGLTSRQVGSRVARIFNEKTFGHIGTLDPMASGLLVIALGEATKMIPFIEDKHEIKEYLFSIKWGIKTDTDDITGNIVEEGGPIPENDKITGILSSFVGKYEQMPPAFSAKKVSGVPAYKLARKGIDVKLSPKQIEIYSIEMDDDNTFKMKCSVGTYVRSVVRDIATKLGTIATCSMIRRTQTNGFDIKNAVRLDFLENLSNNHGAFSDYLNAPDFGLDDIPVTKLEIKNATLFSNGGFIPMNGDGLVRVYSNDLFVGIGEISDGVLKPKRIIKCR
jgi:tRNA pseudouridine55 synthase